MSVKPVPSESTPLVSFVVMCYNTEPYVGDCIRSILGQTSGAAFEVIAVDDCSSDRTFQVLSSFPDARLRLIRHPVNQGARATLHDGIAAARGKFIARIDSDDRYRPGFLAETLPIFERHPEVGLVYGKAALMDPAGTITAPDPPSLFRGDQRRNQLAEILAANFICAPTTIARREAWAAAIPVPEHLSFSDWYINVMMARVSDFYYRDTILADYRVHAGNMHSRLVLERQEEPTIRWVLDTVFQSPEASLLLEGAKRRARRRIYGRQYWDLANKYFGAHMNDDARRCYLEALRFQPQRICSPALIRRLGATLVGRRHYERAKEGLKSLGKRDGAAPEEIS